MPRLLKEILPEGSYVANSDKGRIRKAFPLEYLERVVTTGNKMLAAGLRIPIPFDHSKEALPVELNKSPSSAYNNAGYWVGFTIAPNDKNVPTLFGVADIPGAENQPDTPYYKALNTSKDVSLSIRDEYVDGLGRKWTDAILHGALVNHAVVPNQTDFKEIPEGSHVYNMSMLDSDEQEGDMVAPGLLDQVRIALQEACEIVLPSSSKASVFLRDLLVAASQIKASRPVNGQELQPVPIYMSIGDDTMSMTKEQAESLVATKAINPLTKKPWAMEDLGFKVAPTATAIDMSSLQAQLDAKDAQLAKAAQAIQALVNRTVQDTKAMIQSRVNKLIASGVLTKEYADAHLAPRLDYQMSTLADGTMAPHPLEVTLSALEQMPALNTQQQQTPTFNGFVQPAPFQAGADLAGKELDDAISEFVSFVQ